GINAADTPGPPTHPPPDSSLRAATTTGKIRESKSDPSDICDVCHPRMAWIYRQATGSGLEESPLSQGAAAKRQGSGSW
ncbi:hypothetical protein ACS9ZN_17210, partial [Stenotrophomonas pavanii]